MDVPIKHSTSIQRFAEKHLKALEDKRLDLINAYHLEAWTEYRKKTVWQRWSVFFLSWLIVPVLFWRWYRKRLPSWKSYLIIDARLSQLNEQYRQRQIWKRLHRTKNRLRSQSTESILLFYETLIQSAKQYNSRLDLLDYTLSRQSKGLDPSYTVSELEQIEATFQRVYDELDSNFDLLKVAEKHSEMDLIAMLKDRHAEASKSAEYVSQTVDMGQAGTIIQDLLTLETSLHNEILQFSEK